MEKEKFYGAASFALVLFSALLVKLSGFSASYMVNFQNYIIKTGVSQTSGMSTISALYYFFSPFFIYKIYYRGQSCRFAMAVRTYDQDESLGKAAEYFYD